MESESQNFQRLTQNLFSEAADFTATLPLTQADFSERVEHRFPVEAIPNLTLSLRCSTTGGKNLSIKLKSKDRSCQIICAWSCEYHNPPHITEVYRGKYIRRDTCNLPRRVLVDGKFAARIKGMITVKELTPVSEEPPVDDSLSETKENVYDTIATQTLHISQNIEFFEKDIKESVVRLMETHSMKFPISSCPGVSYYLTYVPQGRGCVNLNLECSNAREVIDCEGTLTLTSTNEAQPIRVILKNQELIPIKTFTFSNSIFSSSSNVIVDGKLKFLINANVIIDTFVSKEVLQNNSLEHVVKQEPFSHAFNISCDLFSLGTQRSSANEGVINKLVFTEAYERDDKDLILNVQGQEIKAHKVIFCTQSAVLKDLNGNTLDIEEFEPEAIELAVKYCYAKRILDSLNLENAINLWKFAHAYEFKNNLKDDMEAYITENVDVQDAAAIGKFAAENKLDMLLQKCSQLIADPVYQTLSDYGLNNLNEQHKSDLNAVITSLMMA